MLNEADLSMTNMAMGQQAQDNCYAEFYLNPRQNMAKTKEEGRPIYDELTYVMIMVPGDKDNVIRRPIRETDKRRFPQQYKAFVNKQEQPQAGTPLSQWASLTRAQVEELKFFGVHTVEALAAMPDTAAQKFMGLNKLRQAAKDHIEAAKSDVPIQKLRAENDELKDQMAVMQAQIAELIAAGKKKVTAKE